MMYLKHIARVNATHIMCTQYELKQTDFKSITNNPSQLSLTFVFNSIKKPMKCLRCLNQCDFNLTIKRKTDLLEYEETDTYIKDDISLYCSELCFMCDSQGVLDDQIQ